MFESQYCKGLIPVLLCLFSCGKGPFDQKIRLEGQTFSLAKTEKNDLSAIYLYVPEGQKWLEADQFIQLMIFDPSVSDQDRERVWKQYRHQYGLDYLAEDDYGLFGHANSNGVKVVSHAREITVDEGLSFLVYIYQQPEDFDAQEAEASAGKTNTALIQIEDQFRETRR